MRMGQRRPSKETHQYFEEVQWHSSVFPKQRERVSQHLQVDSEEDRFHFSPEEKYNAKKTTDARIAHPKGRKAKLIPETDLHQRHILQRLLFGQTLLLSQAKRQSVRCTPPEEQHRLGTFPGANEELSHLPCVSSRLLMRRPRLLQARTSSRARSGPSGYRGGLVSRLASAPRPLWKTKQVSPLTQERPLLLQSHLSFDMIEHA